MNGVFKISTATSAVIALLLVSLFASGAVLAQGDPTSNVNLIGMTPDPADYPDSRYRQQNEPACAIRPGDSACIICAYNDYRAVDEIGDAWEGVSQSCDAGDSWLSRLAPGYPGDLDAELIPAEFAADPRLAAIPGMAIFNFIAGYRDSNVGVLAIQHWLEVNKEDADHYEPGYVTYFADTGTSGRFLDKPDMVAVLDPPNRQGVIHLLTRMENTELGNDGWIERDFPTGKLYVAYAVFTGSNSIKVLVKVSDDWGRTWKNQVLKLSEDQNEVSGISLTAIGNKVLAVWRRRGDNNDLDSIMYSVISNDGKKATKGEVLANLCAFDQPTLTGAEDVPGAPLVTFRTNDFPWTANDGENFFVFFSDRGRASDGTCNAFGRPRIVMQHSDQSGLGWSSPQPLESEQNIANADSFQFMPTAFGANGKVQVAWYDTRRETYGGAGTPWPFVADYNVADQLFVQRTVDVYSTSVSVNSDSSLNIPDPVRVSQYSIRVGENEGNYENYETEASFANKKLFSQGNAAFLGDYIAIAAREFRRTDNGSAWESNASLLPGLHEDFFAAWADNRDVRGAINTLQEPLPYGYAALEAEEEPIFGEGHDEMLSSTESEPKSGPPRDTTKTAEGVEGSDPSPGVCGPTTERTRDANIYGSLIKDEVRLYATTPSKPLSGLKRAFAMSLSNSSEIDKNYRLSIIDQSSQLCDESCRASFRQQSTETIDELIVPAFSTAARTVFIDPVQTGVSVQAQELGSGGSVGPVIASIQLGHLNQMSDPENCVEGDLTCTVSANETHQLTLQSLFSADLLNPALVDRAVAGNCCDDEEYPTIGSVIEWAFENLDPDVEGDAALLNAALLNAALLNANLLNANLLNAALLNANLLNATQEDDLSVLDPELVTATSGCCGSTPTIGDIIVFAADPANGVNAALLNAALLNVNLLNANLLNADLLNANLLNANLLNAALLNANLLNAALLNLSVEAAALLNADLLNAALLNADLLNANLLNPTLVALAVEGGCCTETAEPMTEDIIAYAMANPDKINAALLNAALLNAALLNANLLNANLLNANLLNANLLNADLLNANLLNADLLNANLLNANLLNADLLNANLLNANLLNANLLNAAVEDGAEVTYDDYTFPVTNNGNVTTAVNADITVNAPMVMDGSQQVPDILGTKLMAWTVNATPTTVDCEERVAVDTRVQSVVANPDSILEEATIQSPFEGEVSTIAGPGETVFFTLRVIGTPDQLKNVRISGFTAASQAADCRADGTPDGFCEDDLRNDNEKIIFKDTTPPDLTINGPNPMTLEVGVDNYEELRATAIDNVDGDISDLVEISGEIVDTNSIGSYEVHYNVSDSAGNFAPNTLIRVVNVVDTTAPIITLLGDSTVTIEVGDPYFDAGATADDIGDGDLTTTIVTSNPVNTAIVGSYTVTYDVTDSSTNAAAQATRTVNVVDTTAPVITLLGSALVTVEVGDPYDDAGATADDIGDGDLTGAIVTVNSVNAAAVGSYSVTYNVTDSSANTANQVTRTVNVVDTTAPVISLVGINPVTVEAGSSYIDAGATATDIGDGDLTDEIVTINPVNTGVVGNYSVTYDVTDSSANAATPVSRGVIVQDTTIPTISLTGVDPQIIEAGDAYVELGATADDPVFGDISGSLIIDTSNVDTSAVGNYTVTYDVVDASGNPATQVIRNITVQDTTSPEIDPIDLPGDLDPDHPYPFELNADANTIYVTWPVSVSDADPNLAIGCAVDGNDLQILGAPTTNGDQVTATFYYDFPVGFTTVLCTATDSINLPTTLQFTVEVLDVTPPSAPEIPPDDFSGVEATSASGAEVQWAPLFADDAVDGPVAADCSPATSSVFPIGTTPVSCTATDVAGYTSPASIFDITVVDSTPPTITGVLAVRSVAAGPDGTASPGLTDGLIVSDTVDSVPALACVPSTPLPFGENTITCTAEDASGNSSSVSYVFDVTDDTGPVITLAGADTITLEAGVDAYTEAGATAVDNVDGDVSSAIVVTGSADAATIGSYTIYYDVSDNQGTAADTVSRTVVVQDTIAPVITVPNSPLVVSTDESPATVTFDVSVFDAGYPDTAASCVPASGSEFDFGETPVACNASDGSGNLADSAVFTVNVRYFYDINVIPPKGRARTGSTVPLDWEYLDWDSGSVIDSSDLAVEVRWAKMTNSTCLVRDMSSPEGSSGIGDDSGNSDFRYSDSSDTWQYSWQTPDIAGYHKVSIHPPGGEIENAWKCIRLR